MELMKVMKAKKKHFSTSSATKNWKLQNIKMKKNIQRFAKIEIISEFNQDRKIHLNQF